MKKPNNFNVNLPFFAYGIFRPGQIAYFQIKQFVDRIIGPFVVNKCFLLRDGLPIIDRDQKGESHGALLEFSAAGAELAYERIFAMEPDDQYFWQEINLSDKFFCMSVSEETLRSEKANILFGKSPKKGSEDFKEKEWNSWKDPLFTSALDVVKETIDSAKFEWDMKPTFRLQMAYLLLWSSIERYTSLRYHLKKEVVSKVKNIVNEEAFAKSLCNYVTEVREVYNAGCPQSKETLDRNSPKKSLDYYYQIRSNITHRGKGIPKDFRTLEKSIQELLPIFRDVLVAAEIEATMDKAEKEFVESLKKLMSAKE